MFTSADATGGCGDEELRVRVYGYWVRVGCWVMGLGI